MRCLANGKCSVIVFWAMPEPGVIDIQKTKTKENIDLPWNVVVHNDPVNLMSYVTLVFQRVFGYPRPKAEQLMLTVHERGRAVVWSGDGEQLHGHQLCANLEQPEG